MSRVAKMPISIPAGVSVEVKGQDVWVQGPKGKLTRAFHPSVRILMESNTLHCSLQSEFEGACSAQAGTARALLNNMVQGVVAPFSKKLLLVGVGYRAQVQGGQVTLNLGYSHAINYKVEMGVSVSCPAPTEILIEGIDKQRVGQVAADLRSYRPPEPYKGKGVRYADEVVQMKEAKKK